MKLTKRQIKQLQTLERMKDEDIDFSDIPELTGNEKFIVGKFYRPKKESLTKQVQSRQVQSSGIRKKKSAS
ncbi:MAG TPA: hypothetical protein VGK22_05130 [Candidatus Angelobacter sp.]|jgi:hypothetical protein